MHIVLIATYLDSRQAQAEVLRFSDAALSAVDSWRWSGETGPARATVELVFAGEEDLLAGDALVEALALVVVVRVAEGRFRAVLVRDAVLQGRQLALVLSCERARGLL